MTRLGLKQLELAQETQVVAREETDFSDAVLQHGDALDAHTEGEATIFLWVVADAAQYSGMDHA